MENLRVEISVFGRVQGVLFRFSTKEKAREFGLVGFVKNMPDGSVYIEAQGREDVIEKLISWCHSGPPIAEVERVVVKKTLELKNFANFESFNSEKNSQI